MHTCLICPVPSLSTFIDETCHHHLLLAHLDSIPGYVEFYRSRSECGDYVIVDNGAKENGSGLEIDSVLEFGMKVKAKEIVLTDVKFEAKETVEAGRDSLYWLRDHQEVYRRAGSPRIMVVPQGQTPEEWYWCFQRLMDFIHYYRYFEIPSMPAPTVGFAYHYDHLFKLGLIDLLELAQPRIRSEGAQIHLLGWTRNLQTLEKISRVYTEIRSVDSGRPFSYGKAGLATAPAVTNPGRDEEFFTEPIPGECEDLVRFNINTFREYARDESYQPA